MILNVLMWLSRKTNGEILFLFFPDSFEILSGLGEGYFVLGLTFNYDSSEREKHLEESLSYFESSLRAKDFGDRYGSSVLPQLFGVGLLLSSYNSRSSSSR